MGNSRRTKEPQGHKSGAKKIVECCSASFERVLTTNGTHRGLLRAKCRKNACSLPWLRVGELAFSELVFFFGATQANFWGNQKSPEPRFVLPSQDGRKRTKTKGIERSWAPFCSNTFRRHSREPSVGFLAQQPSGVVLVHIWAKRPERKRMELNGIERAGFHCRSDFSIRGTDFNASWALTRDLT